MCLHRSCGHSLDFNGLFKSISRSTVRTMAKGMIYLDQQMYIMGKEGKEL